MPVVASSVLTPGLALSVVLVSGPQALGASPRRGLIVSPKSSSGSGVANAVNAAVAGADAVATLLGPGSQGHLCAKAAFAEYPTASIDVIAVAAPSGVSASQTLTFDDTTPVTVAQTLTLVIAGRILTYVWLPGVTDTTAASDVAALVVANGGDLPVTAAAVDEITTVTAKYKGVWGNDITIRATLTGGTGGAITLAGSGKLASGTTEPVYTTALTNMLAKEYDLIAFVTSNADAATATSASGPSLVNAKIATRNSGFLALLQQSVFAHTGSTSAGKAGIAQQNVGYCQFVLARGMESLPCELQGAELGARLREEEKDPNVNRTLRQDMPYRATLYPSPTLTSDAYSPVEVEDLLQSGGSPVVYNLQNVPLVTIPRTTYFRDAFSNLDHRLVGVNQTTTYYASGKDLRSFLPLRFAGMKIVPDQPQTSDELPLGVVEESTVRAATILRLNDAVKLGWLRGDRLTAAIADGSLSVKVDASNPNKLNFVIPESAVPGLWLFDVTILGSN